MKFPLKRLSSILFVLAALAFFSVKAYRRYKIRNIINETLTSEHWNERKNKFLNEPRRTGRVVFLGNSLTELFDLPLLGDTTYINRGITGDFTEGVLKRLDEVVSLKPSQLFIEIGINDLVEHVTVQEICINYEEIITRVRKGSPLTHIYLQSLLPVRMKSSFLTSSEDVNAVIKQQNEALRSLAEKHQVTYIDLHDSFAVGNEINPRLTWDGIHLVDEGYLIWKKLLMPYLTAPAGF
jgi:lysophospholipase L1-like esterase